jgi:hypothetical protein
LLINTPGTFDEFVRKAGIPIGLGDSPGGVPNAEQIQKLFEPDRRHLMKRITAVALVVLANLITVGTASAQDRTVQAVVPFDFTVGNKLLPSGTYRITSETTPFLVSIRNTEKGTQMMTNTTPNGKKSKIGMLVFTKYGNQYFLRKVLSSSAQISVELPTSEVEKRVRIQEATQAEFGIRILAPPEASSK